MGVFSGANNDAIKPRSLPTTGRAKRLLATEGLMRGPWQSGPCAVRDAATSPFAPVRGVSLEMFADIAKAIAMRDETDAHGATLALDLGIEPNDWWLASRTWNARIAAEPTVAEFFAARFRSGTINVAS